MAITSSAKKALRASVHKRDFNIARKEKMNEAVRAVRKQIADKDAKKAQAALALAYSAIDKAAKGNTIKWGTADRKKSRLTAEVKALKK